MSVYTGKEGEIATKQEIRESVRLYTELHGEDEDYTKYEVFGKETIMKLAVPGAVAMRIYNGWRDGQTCVLLVPVDKDGKELSVPMFQGGLKDPGDDGGGVKGGDGPRCPSSCP